MRRTREIHPRIQSGSAEARLRRRAGNVVLLLEPLLDVSGEGADEGRDEEEEHVAVVVPRRVGVLPRASRLRLRAVRLDDAHRVAVVPVREDVLDGPAAARPDLEDLEELLLPAHSGARVLGRGGGGRVAAPPALRRVAVEEEAPARLDAESVAPQRARHASSSADGC